MHLQASARSGQAAEPAGRRQSWRRLLPPAASTWWLAIAAALFSLAELVFVVPGLGLGWDETVYLSQVSAHAPAAYFDPARARGIPLLVAPIAAVTSSATAVHVYLAVLSGVGLFLALLVWRPLRPAWLLALAALIFGGLWVTEYYAPQAMPDLWVGLAAVAAVGFFLRAAAPGSHRGALAGLAACVGFAALVRPGDAVFLAAGLGVAIVAAKQWRQWPLLIATAAGLVAGSAEWVAEAYARFGGPLTRLREASREQSGFGLHLGLWDELRAVNGPTLCRPCLVGWRAPELSLWWLALPALVALGLWAARRSGRLESSLLAAVCAFAMAFQYLFLIGYAAPRFLLPAYALLVIPVADGIGWLLTSFAPQSRQTVTVLVGLALALQLIAQHLVLDHEVRGTAVFHDDYGKIAVDLRTLGLRPPCVIKGEQFIPIAFYAGCASASSPVHAVRAAVLEYSGTPPPGYARHWREYPLPGTHLLKLVAYLPPALAGHRVG